jgi:ATP-binding cassette subfamily F protein uup
MTAISGPVATGLVLAEGDGRFTEYAGGYSDMLAQRGRRHRADEARKAAKPPAQKRAGKPQPPR